MPGRSCLGDLAWEILPGRSCPGDLAWEILPGPMGPGPWAPADGRPAGGEATVTYKFEPSTRGYAASPRQDLPGKISQARSPRHDLML